MSKLTKPPDISKYKDSLTFYKTVKTSLKSIIKYDHTIEDINNIVNNVNEIVIHTYQFIKLYYLYQYDNKLETPELNYEFIKSVIKTLCNRDNDDKRGKKSKDEIIKLRKDLQKFYDKHYSKLMNGDNNMYYTHLNTLLDYEVTKIQTCYENHIMAHFYDFFNRYVNVMANKTNEEDKIKKKYTDKDEQKEQLREYRNELKKLKRNLIEHTNNSEKKYNKIKKTIRKDIISYFDDKENIVYQVKCKPLKYIDVLIKMSIYIENKKETTINVFPLRTSIIPSYTIFDTTTVIHALFTEEMNKQYYLTKGNTKKLQHDIWNLFFRLDKKEFNKNGYIFNGEISTDGIAVSILLVRKDKYNPNGKNNILHIKKPKNFSIDRYIDDLDEKEMAKFKKYNVVGIDPGIADLLFCVSENKINVKTFRYSNIQRIKETKSKKYTKILENDKVGIKIDNKTIKEIETKLSDYDKKSCIYKNVKAYIKNKNKINETLKEYYKKELYRKLKWYGFINRQKSEQKMINNFKKIFGNQKETIIAIGDWEQKKNIKYCPPTKGIGFRNLFRKNGYNIFLVDEFNTSKMNYYNHQENEKFRKRINPRPWKTDIRLYHGLLRSKSVPNGKSEQILVNRDKNGALNIFKIAKYHLKNKERPKYLRRTKKQ